jgi:cytidylate kinase
MSASIEQCFSFLNGHSLVPERSAAGRHLRRAVTISRQAGCGAALIADELAQFLQQQAPFDGVKWTVFDRELMERVLAEHDLPRHLAKFLPEDRMSRIEDALAEIFHVHPSINTIIKQTAETLRHLAQLGSAIIIGRAGNIVTARLPHVLHVRLVAPLADRIERICRDEHKTPEEARRFCLAEEEARMRYVKSYFHEDINNPLLYHLVINTSHVDCEYAARMIGEAALRM